MKKDNKNKTIIYITDVSPLKDETLFKKYYNLMPSYRKEKIDRYRYIEDKVLSLGVGLLLKKACHDYSILDDTITLSEFGKPSFVSSSYQFSLSHSGFFAVCALSPDEVGVDIELEKELNNNVASRVFTTTEQETFQTEEKNGFYTLWTLKESLLKKIGKGFTIDPRTIEITKDLKLKTKEASLMNEPHLYVTDIENYKLACSYETEELEIKTVEITKLSF